MAKTWFTWQHYAGIPPSLCWGRPSTYNDHSSVCDGGCIFVNFPVTPFNISFVLKCCHLIATTWSMYCECVRVTLKKNPWWVLCIAWKKEREFWSSFIEIQQSRSTKIAIFVETWNILNLYCTSTNQQSIKMNKL